LAQTHFIIFLAHLSKVAEAQTEVHTSNAAQTHCAASLATCIILSASSCQYFQTKKALASFNLFHV
jgi:hypothetical protein